MKWWIGAGDAFRHCLPDDRWFVALLTAWVGLLVAVTYLLLGWASAGVLIAVAAVFGLAGAVLLVVGIHGFRAVAPRWGDVVLIAVGA